MAGVAVILCAASQARCKQPQPGSIQSAACFGEFSEDTLAAGTPTVDGFPTGHGAPTEPQFALYAGQTAEFEFSLENQQTWSVADPNGGTITPLNAGGALYTAPFTPGNYDVAARGTLSDGTVCPDRATTIKVVCNGNLFVNPPGSTIAMQLGSEVMLGTQLDADWYASAGLHTVPTLPTSPSKTIYVEPQATGTYYVSVVATSRPSVQDQSDCRVIEIDVVANDGGMDAGPTEDATVDATDDSGDAGDAGDADTGCADGGATCPVVLATGQHPFYVAVDGASVYWTDPMDGQVLACAVGGCDGKPTVLASALAGPYDIDSDGSFLYWTDASDGVIRSCPLPGCTPVNVEAETYQPSTGDGGVSSTRGTWKSAVPLLALQSNGGPGGALYYAEVDSPSPGYFATQVYSCSTMGLGCGPIQGATAPAYPPQDGPFGLVAADTTQVYWPAPSVAKSQWYACALGGCTTSNVPTPTLLTTAHPADTASYVAVDSSDVWVSFASGLVTFSNTSSSTPTPFAGANVTGAIGEVFAVEGTCVYAPVAIAPYGLSVVAASKSGGGTVTLFTDTAPGSRVSGVAFDATRVYVAEYSGSSAVGRILAVPKLCPP